MAQHVLTVEDCKAGGQIGGKIGGRKAVESGQLASVASTGGQIGGKRTYERKTGLFARSEEQKKEDATIGGKKGGQQTLKLKTGIHGLSPEERRENGSLGGQSGNHLRWHERLGRINPRCAACRGEV
jgi:hypothetical protein